MPYMPGSTAKIRITALNQTTLAVSGSAQLYGCSKYRVKEKITKASTVNTGSAAYAPGGVTVGVAGEDIPCVVQVEWEIVQASYHTAVNLYGTPIDFAPGVYVLVEILPGGTGVQGWFIDTALIEEVECDGDASQLQPVTLRGTSQFAYSFRPV